MEESSLTIQGESEYFWSTWYNTSDINDRLYVPWRWNLTAVLILSVFGIAVNLALLLVIVMNQHMRTISNLLVANLAVADLIMFVFSVPFDIVVWNVFSWPRGAGGKALCKLGSAVWMLAQVLCIGSLTAVSIERYCTLRWGIQSKRRVFILVAVWSIALVLSLPVLRSANVEHYGALLSFCFFLPEWGSSAQIFVTTYAVLTYLLPVVVITCCYIGMATTLARGVGSDTETVRSRRRLAVAVLFLAVAFIVCWFPIHFINIYVLYADIYNISFDKIDTMYEVGHVLVYVNSCLNPVVVFLISGMHRKPLAKCFGLKKSPASNHNDPYAEIPNEASLSETEHIDEEP